ncbi:hypothetical protein BDP27DRAFT_1454832 [Rhodocollybia butyracea]|uniref:RNA methyltransferase bin3 C-terminal domain-containing protein n=1 Tax=Rhodocollybia butyracea TaxID=206335 RepID=A0A9P5P6P2_9AGAR|nr:hypothetical protein BDP27DRAFT_1454832 [Rhodocollybia butyracea]
MIAKQEVPDLKFSAQPRLALLPHDNFKSKTVLDTGCDEGWSLVKSDIHGVHTKSSGRHAHLEKAPSGLVASKPQKNPTDVFGGKGGDLIVTWAPQRSTIHNLANSYCNTLFGSLPIPPSKIHGKYLLFRHNMDMMLSLRNEGLYVFFQRIYSVLKPRGVLDLNPQEWDTYKKVGRLNEPLTSTSQHLFDIDMPSRSLIPHTANNSANIRDYRQTFAVPVTVASASQHVAPILLPKVKYFRRIEQILHRHCFTVGTCMSFLSCHTILSLLPFPLLCMNDFSVRI